DICKKYDLWIISDEIHCDIIRKGEKHIPLEVACPDYKDRIITCTAPSKSFNLAGMQLSNIVINNKELQEKWMLETDSKLAIFLPNPFAIVATKVAYNDCEDWMNQVNE
ncbi:aminotransferase class I/II-fold pyridoxal phosphate-dependent enzyme, partial [Clostridioides difficile]